MMPGFGTAQMVPMMYQQPFGQMPFQPMPMPMQMQMPMYYA
jgi:hypothetical protein